MRGQAPGWAELPVQYVDYTLWQRAQFGDLEDSGSPIAAQLAYWQDALAGMPERLQLPTDRPYPPVADLGGANVAIDWPAQLQQRVHEVAREHNATPSSVIQAALAVLLSRLSASSDVAVGFPIAGRTDPALDELVGFFVNTLVLRVDVSGDPTVADLLAQVRQRSLAAYEHQDVPFEVLVEQVNPTRSLTHHPLVQVMLAWQNHDPAAGFALADLQVTQMPVDTQTARTDLSFSLSESFTDTGEPAEINGTVEYRTDVFDTTSIETLIERLERVLAVMTADQQRRVSSIDVLDEAERARLDGWGNRAVLSRPATPVSVPECFAIQVRRTPTAVALVTGSDRGPTATRRGVEPVRRTCWPAGELDPGSVWRCCSSAPPRRSSRCWRCSDRGGLPTDRPGAPAGPDRVHDQGFHADRRDPHHGARRSTARRPRGRRYRRPRHRRLPEHRVAGTRTR